MSDYQTFLRAKIKMASFKGFTVQLVCGIGTVPYRAILKGRRGGGSELNPAYFLDQVHYLRAAEREFTMPTLFDALEAEAA